MAVKIKIENGMNVFTKQEEAIYKKFVEEVREENPEVEELIQEFEEAEAIEDTEVIEE